MRKLLIATLAILTGCSSHSGNYTKISDTYNVQMANDSANKLATLYSPTSTQLKLSQSAKDAYGAALVKKLHEKGYAIEEGRNIGALFTPSSRSLKEAELSKLPVKPPTSTASPSNSILSYVVDPVGEELYRVRLSIGSTVLSRIYSISNNIIAPAGSWTRKE